MTGIKDRLVLAIGIDVIERPRQLQLRTDTDEHAIVHCLYRMQKDGIAEFKTKRNAHAPGKNLTKIRLTQKGLERYEELQHE